MSTLQSTGGGKRPARTASSLVLYRSDSTSSDPVNGVFRRIGFNDLGSEFSLSVLFRVTKDLLEFLRSPVREFVVANL